MTKERLRADVWLKSVAPSSRLREWFGHDPAKWSVFKERYFLELDQNPGAVAALADLVKKGSVRLFYPAKDNERNQAVALKEYLSLRLKTRATDRGRSARR